MIVIRSDELKRGIEQVMRKCTDDLPKMIIDQDAQTVEEMLVGTPRGSAWMNRFKNEMVRKGKWEQVWKRFGTRYRPAYRPVRRKK